MAYAISRKIWGGWLLRRVTRLEGKERIPKGGPVLYVANHVGYFDPLLLIATLITHNGFRKVWTITFWPIFWIPGFQQWVASIPLKRFRGGTYGKVRQALLDGKQVAMYPEAHVNHEQVISKIRTGAARLALETRAEIVPVGIKSLSDKKRGFFAMLAEMVTGKAEIYIGKSIDLSDFYEEEYTDEVIQKVRDRIMQRVAKLAGKEYRPIQQG